jgi:hypothetical protein
LIVLDANEATSTTLFERIVAASGLVPAVAPFTIRRLLIRELILPPESVTRDQFERILPSLTEALGVYFEPDEHGRVTDALRALLDTEKTM